MTPNELWLNGAPPPAIPALDELKEYGDLVAFERLACRWIQEWKPLSPLFAQDRPNIVTYADHATLDDVVNTALASVGMYLVVDLEGAVKKSTMKQAFVFNPFTFMVTVTENPLANRDAVGGGTGMPCKRCASLISKAFEGMTIGNGCASLKGITFPNVGDGQQNAVVTFSTQLVVNLDDLLA